MAKVKSYLRLQGSVGESTFLKEGTGPTYRMQDKLVVSKERFKTDPAFARTRENASEFSRSGNAVKLIRDSVLSLLQGMKDKTLGRRLMAQVMKVIASDTTSLRGKGNLVDGDTMLLKGFLFNSNTLLSSVFKKPIDTLINRVTGQLTINVPAFLPGVELVIPKGATHYQLQSAASELDFEQLKFKTDYQQSVVTLNDGTPHSASTLTHSVTPNSTLPLFLSFAIKYFQSAGGQMYPIMLGVTNLVMIIDVSKP